MLHNKEYYRVISYLSMQRVYQYALRWSTAVVVSTSHLQFCDLSQNDASICMSCAFACSIGGSSCIHMILGDCNSLICYATWPMKKHLQPAPSPFTQALNSHLARHCVSHLARAHRCHCASWVTRSRVLETVIYWVKQSGLLIDILL